MADLIVVGIGGNMGSGKDTLADKIKGDLSTEEGIVVRTYRFAQKLKDYAKKYFHWDGNKEESQFVGDIYGGADLIGGRTLLQGIGEMFRQEVSKDFWRDRLVQDICQDLENYKNPHTTLIALVPDMRFINEIEAITRAHLWLEDDSTSHVESMCCYVTRPNHSGDRHPSEVEQHTQEFQRRVDIKIRNDGTLEEFKEQAKALVGEILALRR